MTRLLAMRAHWYDDYRRQRVALRTGCYVVSTDPRITDALRRVFAETKIKQGRMNSGAPASYPVTRLVHPFTGKPATRWQF